MAKVNFPIRHIDGNLIWNIYGEVWAYYKIDGFSYDFLEENLKLRPFHQQLALLQSIGLDLHFLLLPNPTDIASILNRTMEEIKLKDYPLKENGLKFFEEMKKALLSENEVSESNEYHYYLGVQLDPSKNKYKSVNSGLNFMQNVKLFFEGLNSPIYKAIGLYKDDILQSEIEAYRTQAKIIEKSVASGFTTRITKPSAIELAYVLEKTGFSTRNNSSDIRIRKQFEVGKHVVATDKEGIQYSAIRTDKSDFYDLQNVNIEEVSPKTLLLTRITDNDEFEQLYSSYFVVHDMDDMFTFPNGNADWLYQIQLVLRFPVTVSIRANYQENAIVVKNLSNTKLEFKDQRQEANNGGQDLDLTDSTIESGTIQMEKYAKETGFSAYSCSIVFKVTGETKEQLTSRINELKTELSKRGVKIVAPYGEQVQMLYETLVGSKKLTDDYRMTMFPTVLSGLMFGATTNIGDNRGFYIGNTKRFSKPVFIQPDLASKAFDNLGNIVDSISVLVAGMTGRGKSVFMNLYTYLSVLSGSQAVIIDPKGDRKNWVSLPFIPKEYINVWTLGETYGDSGSLDPFRITDDIEDGKEMAMDILSYLADLSIDDDKYGYLSECVDLASKHDDPCLEGVIIELEKAYVSAINKEQTKRADIYDSLIRTYKSMQNNKISVLLFGKSGQKFKVLNPKTPIQVLMIENLSLPDVGKVKLLPKEKISNAIMISITAWSKHWMIKSDRKQHKVILQDEASSIDSSDIGRSLMDFIIRKGRYYNTTLLKGSQNSSDHMGDVANIGMKFSFTIQDKKEAISMLEFMRLPVTTENINVLSGLERGHALFQDIYGRTAIVEINTLFIEIKDAFDSSTSTKEERQRENEYI